LIGVSCPEFSSYDFKEVLPEVAKQFKHWEIFAEAEHHLREVEGLFMTMKEAYDISYSIHAPISDINIASLNERIREDSVIEMLATLESAMNLDIRTVTVHPGLTSMSVPYMEEKSIMKAKKSMGSLDRLSDEYGVTVAIENMPSFPFMLGRTVDEMKQLLDGTNLKMCFDIGHANTVGQIDEFISEFKDRFVNIHIHDNHGEMDEHLTLGEGNIDFPKVLKSLSGYKGNYIIECRSFQSGVESQGILSGLLG
jgi:sugar phosphate isomerase/epimerase